jgi:hypothetical protein
MNLSIVLSHVVLSSKTFRFSTCIHQACVKQSNTTGLLRTAPLSRQQSFLSQGDSKSIIVSENGACPNRPKTLFYLARARGVNKFSFVVVFCHPPPLQQAEGQECSNLQLDRERNTHTILLFM